MKIYEKYIINKIFIPMLVITLGVTAIAWLSQSLRFLDFIVNKGLGFGTFLYLSALIVPSLMWVIIPVAVFISIVYAYNKIEGESELVIFKSSGISNKGLIKPAVTFAAFCTLASYLIGMYALPASYREFKDMQNFIRNNYASILLQEGVFVTPVAGLTVYVKEKDDNGMFYGIMVHDSRKPGKNITMTAEKGYLADSKEGPVFTLIKGTHQEINKETGHTSLLYFDRYNHELKVFEDNIIGKRFRESEERYLFELINPKGATDKDKAKFIAEAHNRITWPLINILMALVALLPFLKGQFNRRGNNKNIAYASLLALLFLVGELIFKNAIPKNLWLTIGLYAVLGAGLWGTYKSLTKE